MIAVEVSHVVKSFADKVAVDDCSPTAWACSRAISKADRDSRSPRQRARALDGEGGLDRPWWALQEKRCLSMAGLRRNERNPVTGGVPRRRAWTTRSA